MRKVQERGNELATIIFRNCISLSFRNLRIHQIATGNGFVTCYLPPAESILPENLSPFNVCTRKCRRQRK